MVDGIALGGFAQGFNQAEQTGIAQDRVGLAQQQLQNNEERQLMEDADKAIGGTLKVISDVVTQAKAAGAPPEKIQRLVAPLMKDISEISQGTGRDPARFENAVMATINAPVETQPSAQDKAVEDIRAKEAAAQELANTAGIPIEQARTEVGLTKETAQTQTPEQQDENNLFGVNVPPVIDDINSLKAPVQKAMFKAQTKAASTAQLLTELQVFKDLIESAQTGQITEVTLPMVQFFKEAGIKLRDDVPALEALISAQNQLALRLRNPDSGFGLTGNTSDRDVTFLKSAVGGLLNTPEGNRAAVTIQIAKMRREADLSALKAQLFERGAPQLFSKVRDAFIKQTPLFTPGEESFLTGLKGGGDQKPAGEMSDDELRRQLGL